MIKSIKVRFLNLFRNIFKIPFLESRLAALSIGKSTNHFYCKLIPNSYQYQVPSMRIINRNGIKLMVDISDYVGHYLFYGYKDVAIEKLFSLCKPNSHVIDVGTNLGWTLLNFAARCPSGNVIGFEPDPQNFNACMKNLGLNQFKNVTVIPRGLGLEESTAMMEVRVPSNRGGNRISQSSGAGSIPVLIERLDHVEEVNDWRTIDLIKIDVEGYELHVLKGAESLLAKFKPTLFIEVDDDNLKDQGDSASELINFLVKAGYSSIEHAETGKSITSKDNFEHCHFDVVAQ